MTIQLLAPGIIQDWLPYLLMQGWPQQDETEFQRVALVWWDGRRACMALAGDGLLTAQDVTTTLESVSVDQLVEQSKQRFDGDQSDIGQAAGQCGAQAIFLLDLSVKVQELKLAINIQLF